MKFILVTETQTDVPLFINLDHIILFSENVENTVIRTVDAVDLLVKEPMREIEGLITKAGGEILP